MDRPFFNGKISCVFKKLLSMIIKLLFGISLLILVSFTIPRLITWGYSISRIEDKAAIEKKPVAIVFGAGLWHDGTPTPVLHDRVRTAADLYSVGKVSKLLLSGDNSYVDYNEPQAMKNLALGFGVPEDDLVLDYAGRRTYDTCYRARHIFGVQDAILVTQQFHLPRALYTCNTLGVSAIGVSADLRIYDRRSVSIWLIRETFATLAAFIDIHITQPLPILGEPEPIHFENELGTNSNKIRG